MSKHETIQFTAGPNGYEIKVPNPHLKVCPECGATGHWTLWEIESEDSEQANFIFKCRNIYLENGDRWECQGTLGIK